MAVRDVGAVQRLPRPLLHAESVTSPIGPIPRVAKHAGERSAGDPHAPFDEAGAGNATMAAGLRATAKAVEQPPEPNVGAPVLDPTGGAGDARVLAAIRNRSAMRGGA